MNRMKWKVMRAFGKLPSSPDIRDMNEAQWIWCYLNIVEDQKEEEELHKARAKYLGLFINHQGVKAIDKAEQNEKRKKKQKEQPLQKQIEDDHNYNENDSEEGPIYVSSTFDEEIEQALNAESKFMELPEPEGQRGDSSMSSDEFIKFMSGNLDQFNELQEHIDFDKEAKKQMEQYKDLDIIEIDE